MKRSKKDRQNINRKRIFAFTIDIIAIFFISKSLMLAFQSFLSIIMFHLPLSFKINASLKIAPLDGLITLITFWSYFFCSYYIANGKSLGKLFTGLQVCSTNQKESYLGLKQIWFRTLGYFIGYFTGSFLLSIPLFRKDQRGLPDFFSKTQVLTLAERKEFFKEKVFQKNNVIYLPYAFTALPAPIPLKEEKRAS